MTETNEPASTKEIATLGAGCFWCIEAVLEQIDGVESVVSGYMGGETKNPTYREICTGRTGHAEVVQVTFDPSVISYKELLDWFWRLHDPTTLNRQGPTWDRYTRPSSPTRRTSPWLPPRRTSSPPSTTHRGSAPASTFHEAGTTGYFDNTGAGYCRAVITKLRSSASSTRAQDPGTAPTLCPDWRPPVRDSA